MKDTLQRPSFRAALPSGCKLGWISFGGTPLTLRGLERDGLIRRTVTVQVPIRVDYEATPLGHKLIVNFQPFWAWAVSRVVDFTAAREKFDRDQEYKSE